METNLIDAEKFMDESKSETLQQHRKYCDGCLFCLAEPHDVNEDLSVDKISYHFSISPMIERNKENETDTIAHELENATGLAESDENESEGNWLWDRTEPVPAKFLNDFAKVLTEDIYIFLKIKECNDKSIQKFFKLKDREIKEFKEDHFNDYSKTGELLTTFHSNSKEILDAFLEYRWKKFKKDYKHILR